ncbi:unnamed protein product [Darwinula stevensoni]|uniref:Uncharacterized protein n=1 Tax=Darwinula stevensoni TaxID=69355 RepID=A0A7R9ACQ7_9CRUS|nr:unnamed protein product [Darwinula stevensoni]CAG0900604.1 unnamed protein product [Darwinula stevensoni]
MIFEQIQLIFGKDVKGIIDLLITFADISEPPALNVVERAGIPYRGFYNVNNSCLYSRSKSVGFFWDEMMKSMGNYFGMLLVAVPVSITMTREVLQHREIIEKNIQDLQEKVFDGLQALGLLQDAYNVVKKKTRSKQASKEKLINIAKRFRETQLKVHKLILESHASFCKLEEIALRPKAITAVEYIDFLIKNEGSPARAKALKASLEAAKWTAEISAKEDWDPFSRSLQDLAKMGLQITFNEEECDVEFLFQEPTGFIQFLKKLFRRCVDPYILLVPFLCNT